MEIEKVKENIIELGISERLLLIPCLPTEASYIDMVLKKEILSKIDLTSEEIELYNIKNINNLINWDIAGQHYKIGVAFKQVELDLISTSLKKLDEAKRVTDNHLSLFDKFCKH